MLQEQESESERRPQQHSQQRFLWVILLLIVPLIFILFYFIPFLSSMGVGNVNANSGWSNAQQRQIAFALAQNVQNYRHRIHEGRRINYGDAYMEATGITTSFRPPIPFDGMNSPGGAKNDTHSEAKLKGWALATIRKNLQGLSAGATINVLIFTQVKVCRERRGSIQDWANQLRQAAPAGVFVNIYTWQQTNFDIDHPDQTPVKSQSDVEFAVSGTSP